jgi:hypothetical protein
MPWQLIENTSDHRGWNRYYCTDCGLITNHVPNDRIFHNCPAKPGEPLPPPEPPAPTHGPGTELHNLIAELGITPTASCGCEAMRQQMNRWGVEGCRENRAEIMAHLQKAYDEASLIEKATALANAAAKRLPKSLERLLDEALRRSA